MQRHKPNFALLISIFFLIIVGAVLISSASVVIANKNFGDPNHYFKGHLLSLVIGFIGMYAAYKIDYRLWKKFAPVLIASSFILLLLVFVPGIGKNYGTFANSWLSFGPISFAPTEVFKIGLIIYLATWLSRKGENIKSFLVSTLPFLIIMVVSAGLIMAQPDLGTLMVVSAIAGVMYFIAGASYKHVGVMILGALIGVFYLIKTAPYRMARFMIFLDPASDQVGDGYQINQALLAIGTGGLFGLGFGQSRQKFNYLPEAASDSIFAVTSEELGFLRVLVIVVAYLVIAYQGFRLAEKAPDVFGRLMAIGVTTWISVQAFINVGANLSLVPLTGVPLPFISMGSSSTLVLMFASGILLNISTQTKGESRESRSYRGRNWWTYIAGSGRH